MAWEDTLTSPQVFDKTVPTDANGNYTITVPAVNALGNAASYALYFKYEGTGTYVDQYFADPYPNYSATAVTVTAGGTTSANKTVVASASIKGTVSLGTSGQTAPAGSVKVSYIESVGSALVTVPESAPVSVDSNGNYSFPNLPPAHYLLHFTYAGTGAYQSKWYTVANGDASGLYGETSLQSSPIAFGAGSDLTVNYVVPSLRTITGHVRVGSTAYPAGAGQVSVSYYYFNANVTGVENWVTTSVTTDSSGNFSLSGLVDGFYGLKFDVTDDSSYVEGQSSQFEVGATATPPITITLIHLISISGHVDLNDNTNANPSSAPANSIKVTVVRLAGQTWAPFPSTTALVDSNGNFTFTGIPDFTSYTLGFQDNVPSQCTTIVIEPNCDYPDQYLGDAPVDAQADYFLTNGSDVVIPTFTMQFANEISGSVKSTGGTPLAGVLVHAYPGELHSGTSNETGEAITDASGSFLIRGLPDGSYHFEITPNGSGYLPKTLPSFQLTGGGIHAGYDETLEQSNTISGTVTADGGAVVSNVAVHAERYDPTTFADLGGYDTTTALNGTYAFTGLPDGDFEIDFISPSNQYAFQSYNNESIYYYPDLITATNGANQTGINATMHLVGTLSGVVTAYGGTSLDIAYDSLSAEVEVYDTPTSSWVETGDYYLVAFSAGADRYTIPYLSPGNYRLRFDYFGQTGNYNNATFVSPPIVVTAGQTTTYNTAINVTGPNSTDSSIDSITASKAGVSVAGWAVWPGSVTTSVGVAVNIGSGWYSLTANKPSTEAAAAEAYFETVGPNHGFSGTIAVAPGTYNACIYVLEPNGAGANIGCQTVTVPVPGQRLRSSIPRPDRLRGSRSPATRCTRTTTRQALVWLSTSAQAGTA